jgi:hypothetical protein
MTQMLDQIHIYFFQASKIIVSHFLLFPFIPVPTLSPFQQVRGYGKYSINVFLAKLTFSLNCTRFTSDPVCRGHLLER